MKKQLTDMKYHLVPKMEEDPSIGPAKLYEKPNRVNTVKPALELKTNPAWAVGKNKRTPKVRKRMETR